MLAHHFEPICLAVVGVGALVHGLAEVLLGRGATSWRVPLVLAGALALFGCLSLSLNQSVYLGQGACLLAGAELGLAFLRWSLLPWLSSHPWGQPRPELLTHSGVHGLILFLAGGTLLASQVFQIERTLHEEVRRDELHMQRANPLDLFVAQDASARTDASRPVPLHRPPSGTVSHSEETEHQSLNNACLQRKLIQTGPADASFNCHGWVFAAGRYWLHCDQVDAILQDNTYHLTTQPQLGDVAVYRDRAGQVTHSGLVCGITGDGPLIESKWGRFGRYVHPADQHWYRGSSVSYYHTTRGSHLLNGLESPHLGAPPAVQPIIP